MSPRVSLRAELSCACTKGVTGTACPMMWRDSPGDAFKQFRRAAEVPTTHMVTGIGLAFEGFGTFWMEAPVDPLSVGPARPQVHVHGSFVEPRKAPVDVACQCGVSGGRSYGCRVAPRHRVLLSDVHGYEVAPRHRVLLSDEHVVKSFPQIVWKRWPPRHGTVVV